jgi:RNA polymerase primary sigma factor
MIQEGKLVHLDAPVADGSDDTIADTLNLGPPKTETIVEARRLHAEYQQAIERITSAVDELPPRKAMIVRLRLGLGEFEAMTLEEIGARYELTRERIRQIEADAYKELELKLGITPAEIEEIVDVAQDLEVVANAI